MSEVDLLEMLESTRVIDLTHSFGPGVPLYDGFEPAEFQAIRELEPLGVHSQVFRFPGQCGTHLDPPGHLCSGLLLIDAMDPKDLILPLAVIDASSQADVDPDYMLRISDIEAWETLHGRLPPRCFLAMKTSWSSRWPSDEQLQNRDAGGVPHWPGWSQELLQFLDTRRSVAAIGHETLGTDGGIKTARGDFGAQRFWHSRGKFQIELLKLPSDVPESGGLVFCGVPKPLGGTGFPVRALALVPSQGMPSQAMEARSRGLQPRREES